MNKLRYLVWLGIFFFCAGGAIDSGAKENSEKVLAKEVIHNLEDLYKRGVGMEKLRVDSKLAACGVAMRKNQAFAVEVDAKAETLSNKFLMVKIAANPVSKLCVSCVSWAVKKHCKYLKQAIEEARPSIQ